MRSDILNNVADLTSGRLLARNTIINVAGEIAPFLVALFAVPLVVNKLGVARYGVLTLSMMIVGYLGLFDLGLGSASTKFIAQAASSNDPSAVRGWFWTSLYLMLAFGLVAAALIAALAPWLVDILKIPVLERSQTLHAFYLLALSMPFVVSANSLTGTLAAHQRFDLINMVRIPSGIFSYAGPLISLAFSHSLAWIVAIVVAGRVAGWITTGWLCVRIVPSLLHDAKPQRAAIGPLLSFGGWVTVSGIVGPIMVYFDRFLVGAMLSVAAVAYYTVPFQIVGKLGVLPGAMGGVVFAAFSSSFEQNPNRAALIFERATRYTLLVLFVPTLLIIALAPEGLTLWLGAPFAAHSANVLRWLGAGTFINCLAWTPYSLVQAAHRPDMTAKLHAAEVPFYLAFLWWVLSRYGVVGAAAAWTLRAAADMVILYFIAHSLLPLTGPAIARLAKITAIVLAAFALAAAPMALVAKAVVLAAVLGAFALFGWTLMLEPIERSMLLNRARRIVPVGAVVVDHG